MKQLNQGWQPRNFGRHLSSQTEIKQDSESEIRYQKALIIFNQLYPQLINRCFNWYLAINSDTNEYFLEQEYLKLFERLRQQPQKGKMVIFRVNETGICGRI